jgi:serpin B
MTRLSRRSVLALPFLAAASCLPVPQNGPTEPDEPSGGGPRPKRVGDTAVAASASNRFAFDLYGRLRSVEGNLFLSPLSAEAALAMTACGANGNTLAEMRKVLHLPDDAEKTNAGFAALFDTLNQVDTPADKRGFQLAVANALWGQKGCRWRSEYIDVTRAHYDAGLTETDFNRPAEACDRINGWADAKTSGKIRRVLEEAMITPLTRLVLTNAVYFKGVWRNQFSERATADGPFTLADGSKRDVALMRQTAGFRYAESDELQAVELPYRGAAELGRVGRDDVAMTVVLPKAADGLPALEQKLTADKMDGITKAMKWEPEVKLTLPRFKIEGAYSLKNPLAELGMKDAFDVRRADFSGMTSAEQLHIAFVIQKSFVDVNEEGTEAAAVTAVAMAGRGMPRPPKVFQADRPFLFLIRHVPTNTILFLGRFEKP